MKMNPQKIIFCLFMSRHVKRNYNFYLFFFLHFTYSCCIENVRFIAQNVAYCNLICLNSNVVEVELGMGNEFGEFMTLERIYGGLRNFEALL